MTAAAVATPEFRSGFGRMRSILSGSAGNLVEWYDWFAYSAFTLYFAKVFFPQGDQTAQLLNAAVMQFPLSPRERDSRKCMRFRRPSRSKRLNTEPIRIRWRRLNRIGSERSIGEKPTAAPWRLCAGVSGRA